MKNGYKAVTMQDIADKLGISKNAVSIVMSDRPGVSNELRDSILKTAREMGYVYGKKGNAQSDKRFRILMIIPEYIFDDKFFYYDIYHEMERKSRDEGMLLERYCLTKLQEQNLYIPMDQYDSIDSVILIGVVHQSYAVNLKKTVKSVVFLDNYYHDLEADYVLSDGVGGAYQAVEHLIGLGHRKIGFIGAKEVTSSLYDRWVGYMKALEYLGGIYRMEFCITPRSELVELLHDSNEFRSYLEQIDEMPTAWITGNDRVAYALINFLREKGYRVPEDISVVGFDDMQFSRMFSPPLTTVRVMRERMADEAVRLARDMHANGHVPAKREYYTELVIRESTCKVKNQV